MHSCPVPPVLLEGAPTKSGLRGGSQCEAMFLSDLGCATGVRGSSQCAVGGRPAFFTGAGLFAEFLSNTSGPEFAGTGCPTGVRGSSQCLVGVALPFPDDTVQIVVELLCDGCDIGVRESSQCAVGGAFPCEGTVTV